MPEFDDIADLIIPSETVGYRDKVYQVQGLSAPHLIHIVRTHGAALAPIYQQAAEGKLPADLSAVATELGDNFTSVAGSIIACGMGRPEQAAKCAQLPFAVQLDALDKIIRLTLEVEGGLGKVVEIVTKAARDLAPLRPQKA